MMIRVPFILNQKMIRVHPQNLYIRLLILTVTYVESHLAFHDWRWRDPAGHALLWHLDPGGSGGVEPAPPPRARLAGIPDHLDGRDASVMQVLRVACIDFSSHREGAPGSSMLKHAHAQAGLGFGAGRTWRV